MKEAALKIKPLSVEPLRRRLLHAGLISSFILICGVLLSLGLWHISREQTQEKNRLEFDFLFAHMVDSIEDRIKANEQVLRGVVGLFISSDDVSRTEFHAYVGGLNLDNRYPGIQGVGFSQLITPEKMAEHIQAIRKEGFPEFTIHPQGERKLYTSSVYLEPSNWRNQRALGFDMYSEPVRQEAMLRAWESGKAALSGKVTLRQETNEDVQAGVVLYIPIYRAREVPKSIEARRNSLQGWAFSPLRLNDLMTSLIKQDHPELSRRMAITIHDGDTATPDTLLFETHTASEKANGPFNASRLISLAGHPWRITAQSLPRLDPAKEIAKEYIVLAAGIAISLLLAALANTLIRSHARKVAALAKVTQINHELDKNRKELQTIYDTSSVALFFVDLAGTITHANQRMAEMFDCPLDELIGSEYINYVHLDQRDAGSQRISELLRGEIALISLPYCYCRNNNTEFWGHLSCSPTTDIEGHVIGIVGVIEDVTERLKNEEELKKYRHQLEKMVKDRTAALSIAKEAAETANRAKSTFLANMSHELRSPMNAIMGMTHLAKRSATDPKQKDQLFKVMEASQHLLTIINDILDLSKIEAERLTLEEIEFKLGTLLEDLSSLAQKNADDKRVQLRITGAPELTKLWVKGDPLRLGQILFNLTDNAIKFTAEGSVNVSATLVEELENHIVVRFEVRDTGIGISEENQKRLFSAFEQGDGSMTRRYGGTGLGLTISKRLAQLMGGNISMQSEPDVGSTFWFTVRLSKTKPFAELIQTSPALMAEKRLKTLYSGARILLAEDEPMNQEVSRGLLEEVEMHVDLATDGTEAVNMAMNGNYDLILMDMQMPHMNGIEATHAIRQQAGLRNLPIIAMTANAFEDDRLRCLEAGMNDHIGKPIDPELFFKLLLKWLPLAQDPEAL